MLKITKLFNSNDIRSNTLRERVERGHCGRSIEFLALMNEEEAGFLSYEDWSDREPGFIYEIFTLPTFRRQGIGLSLLLHAECYAIQLGCKSIRLKPYALDQEPDRNLLMAWYTKMGYHQARDNLEHMEKQL